MKKFLLLLFVMFSSFQYGFSQLDFWKPVEEISIPSRDQLNRPVIPEKFDLYKLSVEDLRAELRSVPHESQLNSRQSYAQFELPIANGQKATFQIVEYDMMESKLQRKFPKIKTYKGYDINSGAVAHINLSNDQIFAAIRLGSNTIYIDPYSMEHPDYYIAYNVRDHQRENFAFYCDQHEIHDGEITEIKEDEVLEESYGKPLQANKRGDDIDLRTYRLAVTAAGEFTQFYNGTVDGALNGIVTIVNRLNSIYENDASIRFILVNDNDKLIFLDPATDPFDDYPSSNGGLVPFRNKNQEVCDLNIGPANYDVGHVLGQAPFTNSGQGVASIATVCNNNQKALGSSIHTNPFGDRFSVNIVAHEMGHQFGGLHTMYHCHNVQPGNGFEPGSGSTIMAYTGICSSTANVQTNSDPYFHVNTLEIITNFSRNGGGNSCRQIINNDNREPDITLDYENGFYIPVNTAFRLSGTAEDPDGDDMTYSWEQYQVGSRNYENNPWNISQPTGNEPLFRSNPPSTSATRYFPALPRIVNNVFYKFELLPTYARDLVFRFVVRDNNPEGGLSVWETMNFKTHDNSADGVFKITNFNLKDTVYAGGTAELTWDVAATDLDPINCKRVNVRLSLDGGTTFPIMVKRDIANDGSTFINFPDTSANRIRFMLEAANNIFLDVNDRSSELQQPNEPNFALSYDDRGYKFCVPEIKQIEIQTSPIAGLTDDISFEFSGILPAGAVATFEPQTVSPGESTQLILDLRDVNSMDTFNFEFSATSDTLVKFRTIEAELVANDFTNLSLDEPSNGALGVSETPILKWSTVDDADSYTLEVAADAAFNDIVYSRTGISGGQNLVNDQLSPGAIYYWRVKPLNSCGEQDINKVSSFQVRVLDCVEYESTTPTQNLSQTGTPEVEMSINTGNSVQVTEINITHVRGQHNDFGNLTFSVEGPSGAKAILVDQSCEFTAANFDFGFDDESTRNLNCIHFGGGTRYKPVDSLARFVGETGTDWKLIVKDNVSGDGGRLESWAFEVCGSLFPTNPELSRNDSIHVFPGNGRLITSDYLMVTHPDFGPSDLTFTIVETPNYGTMKYDGSEVGAGFQFSMQDVIDEKLRYSHNGLDVDEDHFSFTVSDPGMGYYGTPSMRFVIDEDTGILPTNELPEGTSFSLFPNPASNVINLAFSGDEMLLDEVIIYTIHGQVVERLNKLNNSRVALEVNNMNKGLYLIQVRSGDYTIVRKFAVQ
jgi:subtilisin-like proprotein convertase family protein